MEDDDNITKDDLEILRIAARQVVWSSKKIHGVVIEADKRRANNAFAVIRKLERKMSQ